MIKIVELIILDCNIENNVTVQSLQLLRSENQDIQYVQVIYTRTNLVKKLLFTMHFVIS